MRLLRIHILKSVIGPFIFAWTALTGMLMLNQLSRRFGDLVGKGLPPGVITTVLLLFIPFIVALTLPMAVLVSVLYGFSQLGADNEITAMRANGVSVMQMVRPMFLAGILLSLANFLFIDQVLPRTNLRLLNLQNDISQKKPTFALKETVMNNLPGSLYTLRATRIEPVTGRMREVVIYDMSPADARRVIYAESGQMAFQEGGKDLILTLNEGRAHEYKTAEPATVHVTRFNKNTIFVRDIENAFQQRFGSMDKGDREMTTCEMMDRVERSRQTADRAGSRRRALAVNDLRALLHLWGVPDSSSAAASAPPPPPRCGKWRVLERAVARLLLPRPAKAQTPVVDSAGRITAPLGAAFSSLSDVTIVREEEEFARGDINKFQVEIHKKFTLSVACVSFVLIGIALALRFPRGGIGLVIGASLVIFALFYVSLTAGEQLADRDIISPAVAMWFPNLVVLVAGVLGLIRVNREFGSTRGGDLGDLAELLTGWIRRRRAS
ncbi:MAG TPA: LptF/LptG family permease [Gemmatimonadales bacterium]